MRSSIYILVALVCVFVSAADEEDLKLPILEGGEKFDEKIKIIPSEGIEEISTPDHCDRRGVTQLIDSVNQIVVDRLENDKYCTLYEYTSADGNPAQLKAALAKTHNTFPLQETDRIETFVIQKPYEGVLPNRIKAFCKGRKIVSGVKANVGEGGDMTEVSKHALKEAIASKGNARKRATVREFIACTNASSNEISNCSGSQLSCRCKIRRPSCTYKISCPMDLKVGGFKCKGLHKLNSIVCCDYKCNKSG